MESCLNALSAGVWRLQTQGDNRMRVHYRRDTADGVAMVCPRFSGSTDYVDVVIRTNRIELAQRDANVSTILDSNLNAPTLTNTWYTLEIVCDGSNVTVWRGVEG